MKDKKLISTFKKTNIISSTIGGKLIKRLMIFDYQPVDRNDKIQIQIQVLQKFHLK